MCQSASVLHEKVFTFDTLSQQSFDGLDELVTTSLPLASLTFESDVYFQNSEFYDLVDIKKGSVLIASDVKKTLWYLKLKNKFKKATIQYHYNQEGIHLHFIFEGLWTFNKVKFYGAVLGKDRYRQYYSLEPGEAFDIKKHYDCLEKIKEIFAQEGYFDAKIVDDLEYRHALKEVRVNIIFDPGVRYTIQSFNLLPVGMDAETIQEYEFIIKKIRRRIHAKFDHVQFSQEQVDIHTQYVKNYLIKQGFINVHVNPEVTADYEKKIVSLTFNVMLSERRKSVFFGNQFFSKKELLDHLLDFGDSLYVLPSSLLVEELVQFYKNKGFWNVSIQLEKKGPEYYFLIQEGERAVITDFSLKGVQNRDVWSLEKNYFNAFLKQKYFEAETLKNCLKNFISYYLQQGFWDVKVLKQEYIPLAAKNNFKLVITFDEGPRRYLNSLSFDDAFSTLLNEAPFARSTKNLPQPFDFDIIQQQRQWLLAHFQKQGYLYADVWPEFSYKEDYYVDVRWHIDLKEKAVSFGKIIVAGAGNFKYDHLKHRLSFYKGMVWDKKQLEHSLSSLRSLNCFETISMYPYNIAIPEEEKPIVIKLVEDDPCEARLRVGFAQVSKNLTFREGTTYRLGGSFLYKNPTHVGDYFFVNSDATRFYRYVSGMYFRPWGLYNPTNLIFKGYANKYIQPVRIGSNKPLYNAVQQGFLMGLSRQFSSVDFGLNMGIEVMETKGLSKLLAEAINFEPALVGKGVPYLYCEPSIFIDFLDNKLNPVGGSLTILSAKGMYSWQRSSVNFFKILAEQLVFIPFYKFVLGFRARLGHIFNQKFRAIMPPERFYLGGANSLRSYEPDLAPPLGIFIEENGKHYFVPQGGKSMFNATAELKFFCYKNIGVTVFHDVGYLSDNHFSDIKPEFLLAATGFGLRYETPVGPLRFEIGFKWKRRIPEESLYAWFLTFGNAF